MRIFEPFIENRLPEFDRQAKNAALARPRYEETAAAHHQFHDIARLFHPGVRANPEVQRQAREGSCSGMGSWWRKTHG
jgi:hypothetical protein